MSDQKWTINRSRTILKDHWIDVRADDCVTASGSEIAPYYVLTYPDWVHVVAVTAEGCLVLVSQYRHAAVGQVFTELPGGMTDPTDVDHEQAARRELAEETGYASSDWRRVVSLFPNPATHTNRVHVYLALNAVPHQAQHLDQGEVGVRVVILPIDDVLKGIQDGYLGQAMQVSALLLGLAAASLVQVDGTRFRALTP